MNVRIREALQAAANKQRGQLCGATDGLRAGHLYGRCNLPAGHQTGGWHQEKRKARVWAEWRGPMPGERCGICGRDGRQHLPPRPSENG